MSRLHDKTSVDFSIAEAQTRLEAFLTSLRGQDGVARMRLRVPITGMADSFGLALDREVRIEARRRRDEPRQADVTEIVWQPEGTTVLPRFEGTLFVTHDGSPNRSDIELDGEYTPPFGAAGQVFDAAIGQQIARTTAREFLLDLKRAIELRG
jgi:hypothetical protein